MSFEREKRERKIINTKTNLKDYYFCVVAAVAVAAGIQVGIQLQIVLT